MISFSRTRTNEITSIQERAKAAGGGSKPKGNLQRQLDAQKSQTQSDTLSAAARENLDTRNVDAADKQRNWD